MRTFDPGEQIVHRDLHDGEVWYARAETVVEDSQDRLLLHWCPGAEVKFPSRPADGSWLRIPTEPWVLSSSSWHTSNILCYWEPSDSHSVWLFWDEGWQFQGWYVNLQGPFVRTEHDGKHEPIVSPTLFNKVQRVLVKHNTAGSHSWKYAHHLKGFLTCGTCGARMSYMLVKQKQHGYFYCLGKHRRRTKCDEPYVSVESIEAQVEGLFRGIKIPKEFYGEIVEEIEAEIASRETDRAGSAKFLSKRLDALSKKREKLLELWYQEAIDLAKFKSEQEKIDEEMKAVSRELDVQTDELRETRDVLDVALKLAKNVGRSFEKATPDVKKLWLEACFREIQVSDKEISSFVYRAPFDRLVAIDGGKPPTSGSNSTVWLAHQDSNLD